MANKAGIGICFDIAATSFLFVTAHFAAHKNMLEQRNRSVDFFLIFLRISGRRTFQHARGERRDIGGSGFEAFDSQFKVEM